MKRILLFSVIFAAGMAAAQAAVPYRVSFQGRLDDGGSPATGTRAFVFKIYDALTGGTLLWTSQTESVPVTNGVFSVVLETGAPSNLSTGTFSGARFVEISVDGTLLSPRETVVSAPYALVAQSLAPGATVYLSALEKDPSALSTVNTATNPVDWSQLKNVPGSVLAAGGALTVTEGGATVLTPSTTMDFDANQFNISGAAATASVTLAPSSVTLQGNAFNGNSQLVLLDAAGKFPALDGSALTALNASNLGSGTLASARLSGSYTNALTFGSAAGGPITFSTNVVITAAQLRVGNFAAGSIPSAGMLGAGAIHYNSSDGTLYVSNGAAWSPLASGGASPWSGGGTGTVSLVAPADKVSIVNGAADAITVAGGITAGSGVVGIVDTTGKIPALSSTYLASLSGANLTSLTAANIAAGTLGTSVVASSVPAANVGVGKLGAQVVASSLAVNSVYAGAIAAGAVSATSIGAGTLGATVVASSVPASNVGVGKLGAQVVASSIALNGIYTGAIADLAVTDAKINDVAGSKITGVGSIVADRIAAGTLGTSVVASSVPAANVGVGKLGAQVVVSSLAINSVYSGAIAAGAVTATSIGAGTLGATVVASSVPASNVGVGWLGAQVVASSIAVNAVQDNSIVGVSSSKLSGGIAPTLVNLSTVAALGSPNTFTSSQTINGSGLSVMYGIVASSVSLTGGITASSATLTGDAEVRGGLIVGGGTKVTKHLSATFALTANTTTAPPECVELPGNTLTGAALGDTVVVSADIALPADFILQAYVSAADTVAIRWCQIAGAATDPDGAGANYRLDVWQH